MKRKTKLILTCVNALMAFMSVAFDFERLAAVFVLFLVLSFTMLMQDLLEQPKKRTLDKGYILPQDANWRQCLLIAYSKGCDNDETM